MLFNYLVCEYIYQVGNDPDVIGMLQQHFDLNLGPLQKVAALPEYTLEEWRAEFADSGTDEEEWHRDKERNQLAWQEPQILIDCLRAFVRALDSEPDIFSRLEVTESYFVEGSFRQDLVDLLSMAEWAKENGANRIRLYAS